MATGYEEFEAKMKKTSELLGVSFASVRAGRANAGVLDQIQVDYYGTPTPIQQIATISTPTPGACSSSPGIPPRSSPSRRPSWPPTSASTLRTTGAASAWCSRS